MLLRRKFLWTSVVVIASLGGTSFIANRAPHSAVDVAMLSDRLFEFGTVDFVHGAYAGPEQALFDCVRDGQALSTAQSIRYRTAYQALLHDKQSLFAALDQNIELRKDERMTQPNNVAANGIEGLHDHHDASASNNIANIAENLTKMKIAGPLHQIILANDIYKDLTDLMVHLAPAVHSVGLLPLDRVPAQTHPSYLAFYEAMKRAQASNVNSASYWQNIETAQAEYALLILDVQHQIRAMHGAFFHMLSGRWLALQTIAPRLSESSPSAQERKKDGPHEPPCLH